MSHPKCDEAKQRLLDENPFEGLYISDNSILNTLEGRHPCPKCGKSRKYFCYTCYVPIAELEGKLPTIKLPLKIDIIKHKHEIDGKSTASHAAILAPADVSIYTYPDIPDYDDENVVLIFPSYNAVDIAQLFTESCEINNTKPDCDVELPKGWNQSTLMKQIPKGHEKKESKIERLKLDSDKMELPIAKAVFIDSTWNQSRGIYKDERIKKIPSVVIQNRISQFWRHQKGSPRWYLATIEAIHQFLLEIHLQAWGVHPHYKGLKNCFTEKCLVQYDDLISDESDKNAYNGQYDDLLYFFQHMYDLIHLYYEHDNLYAYKRRLM